jgi:hypothetical protein
MRRFNRETGRLTTLVLGAATSVAFMLAILVQDRHSNALDFKEKAMRAGDELAQNANSGTLLTNVGLQGKVSPDEITTGQVRSVDHAFIETITRENPSSLTPTSVLTPSPASVRISRAVTLPTTAKIAPRTIRRKIRSAKYLSSVALRSGSVKMRLIALWRQSLARSGKSRNWGGFSNLNDKSKKKAAYTAKSNR